MFRCWLFMGSSSLCNWMEWLPPGNYMAINQIKTCWIPPFERLFMLCRYHMHSGFLLGLRSLLTNKKMVSFSKSSFSSHKLGPAMVVPSKKYLYQWHLPTWGQTLLLWVGSDFIEGNQLSPQLPMERHEPSPFLMETEAKQSSLPFLEIHPSFLSSMLNGGHPVCLLE